MHKSALLWLLLAVVAGVLLFQTSQRVTDGRQKLAALTQNLQAEEESLRVLQAEWSYLNQPDRLEKLSREYLKLAPMKGRQFARAESLPLRAAGAEAPAETLALEPTPAAVTSAAAQAAAAPAKKPRARKTPAAAKPRPAAARPAPEKPGAAQSAPARNFGDVIQSLGVAGP